jgi:phosphatidylserine/phosphatidylglycerophosphate/cardiolipin synthase-like enzyme
VKPLFVPGETCWRIEQATRASVIVDAADYFAAARQAMLKASKQILLIGWDFDARIAFSGDDEGPDTIGTFFPWLVDRTPGLQVHLLRWDMGAIKSLARGTTLLRIVQWAAHPAIHMRLDGHHPTGASHHQKIVVIDDCLAFCGGIDMTAGRWDRREHRDPDPERLYPSGGEAPPWHDATTALEGDAARALGELARDRWQIAGGTPIEAPGVTSDCWPESLTPDFRNVQVAVARTVPEMDDQAPCLEVEALYLALIARARKWIYAESQYFASRRVAEAIARRLQEPDGPEVVIVNPEAAEGWLEPLAMDSARARLVEAIRRRDPHRRFRLYHPFTARGSPIYVHAKVTVIDDLVLRVGSSNFNNRSMRLDTECDVAIEGTDASVSRCIARIRNGLIAEHLDCEVEQVAATLKETGSLISTIEQLRGPARTLRDYLIPNLSEVEDWLAKNEVLDPKNPEDVFEAISPSTIASLVARVADR